MSHNGTKAGAVAALRILLWPERLDMRRKHRQSHLGHKRRSVIAVVTVVVLVLVAAAADGGYLLLRTKGSPQETEASYLSGWQRGDYSAMDRVSVNVPRSGLAVSLRQAA